MPTYREAPPVRKRPFGLFSVADVTTKSDGNWEDGAIWESLACGINVSYAQALCATPAGTNEVQTLSITGSPTGGTYTLTAWGQTTTPLNHNSNAATIQSALLALSAFDTGDVVVTGTYPNFTFTFGGQYAAENVPQITATAALTGGTTPAANTATTTPGVTTPKTTVNGWTSGSAAPFAVYVETECRTVGEANHAKDKAMKMLVNAEERGVELELWTRMIANPPVDLTPAANPSPEAGLAIMLESFRARYDGAATVHVSTDLGQWLAGKGAIERRGNRFETQIGDNVSIGAGYPRTGIGGVPAAGAEWMLVTGTVVVDRGPAATRGPVVVQAPLDNTILTLAERVYVAGWDCQPAAIRVAFP